MTSRRRPPIRRRGKLFIWDGNTGTARDFVKKIREETKQDVERGPDRRQAE